MITMQEYAKRRKALMKQIGKNGIIILFAAKERARNADALFPYRQDSDFYYLTGFNEPEAVMILAPERKEGEYILFNRVRDRSSEIWDGPRAGQEGAKKHFKANQSFPISMLDEMLPGLMQGRESIHYPIGYDQENDEIIIGAINKARTMIRGGVAFPTNFQDISPTIHEMRLIKSKDEIAIMRKAAEISAKAHVRAMQACRPGLYEYSLDAELTYEFVRHGAKFAAYTSIVGAGKNSCVLHYIANDKKIEKEDIVLIDAGCEYHNYASDITRTFPASGKFSDEQRAIYDLVLKAQLAAIKAVKPGASWTDPQEVIVKIITKGLLELGLLKGDLNKLIEKEAYFPFYMHRSGHYLGLDVHDRGRYKVNNKWRKLTPGMVLTVEPGIYISEDIKGVAKRWHHIGVRIEDDVLVTKKGCEVLSHGVPKDPDAIEALMAK